MMMSSSNNENKFSVDLCTNAQAHLQFLKLVHSNGTSLATPSKESLRRYYDLWLPLVYEHRSLELIPPIDVAWIWHCDRLAPTQYENDLKELFGPECPILDAKAPFCLQTPNDHQLGHAVNTVVFWKKKFPDETFFLDEDKKKSKKANNKKKNQRILASTEHQAKFLWQVSGPKYSSIDFLKQGVEEYYKFLNLRNFTTSKQNQIIVPTLQIDLMWHTHILSSLQAYHKDCIAIMKTRLNHDDSIKQKKLEEFFRATTALWKQHYEEDYFVSGGMNRGEPPKEFYKPEWAATSSAASASASTTATPSSPFSIVWCWKETSGRIETHDKSKIVGDPSDGWIQYDKDSNNKIEQAYQQQGNKHGSCVPIDGYNVNFTTMKQTKVATGYERDVQRFHIIWCWQETEGQISAADRQNSLIGDPSDEANIKIETAFQNQNGKGTCLPLQGYVLDFDTMKQIKMSTGYERKVERVPIIASNDHQPNKKKDPEGGGRLFAPNPYTPFATAVAVQEGDADPLSTADVTASGGVSTTATAAPANDQDSKQTMYAMKWCLAASCICCVCIVIVGIAVLLAVFFTTSDDGSVDVQSIPSLSPATTSPTTSPIGTMTPAITSPTTSPNRGGGRWACGRAPWSIDKQTSIDRPGTPLCLRIKPKQASNDFNILREPEGPLCMAGGEPLHQPPMWCYVDPSASTYKSYYLWWSPCTRCGTAWRLDEDRDDDKSMFKSPAEDPGPHGFPGDSWLRWTGSEWSTDVEMEITPCHAAECYIFDVGQYVPPVQTSGDGYSNNVQQESSGGGGGGLFGIIFGVILVFVVIACVIKFGGNGRGGRHSGGGCGGGGCGGGGGGGGGCGGGGGGCGGC